MFGQRLETSPHNYFPISPGSLAPGGGLARHEQGAHCASDGAVSQYSAHHQEAAGHNRVHGVRWQVQAPSGVSALSAGIKCNHHVHHLHTVHRALAAVCCGAACVRAHNSQLPRVRNLALSVVTRSPSSPVDPLQPAHTVQKQEISRTPAEPRTRACPRPGSDLCVQVCTETTGQWCWCPGKSAERRNLAAGGRWLGWAGLARVKVA